MVTAIINGESILLPCLCHLAVGILILSPVEPLMLNRQVVIAQKLTNVVRQSVHLHFPLVRKRQVPITSILLLVL